MTTEITRNMAKTQNMGEAEQGVNPKFGRNLETEIMRTMTAEIMIALVVAGAVAAVKAKKMVI